MPPVQGGSVRLGAASCVKEGSRVGRVAGFRRLTQIGLAVTAMRRDREEMSRSHATKHTALGVPYLTAAIRFQ